MQAVIPPSDAFHIFMYFALFKYTTSAYYSLSIYRSELTFAFSALSM